MFLFPIHFSVLFIVIKRSSATFYESSTESGCFTNSAYKELPNIAIPIRCVFLCHLDRLCQASSFNEATQSCKLYETIGDDRERDNKKCRNHFKNVRKINLIGLPTTADSNYTFYGIQHGPALAINGNKNQDDLSLYAGNCIHTNFEGSVTRWMLVDIGSQITLAHVVIYHRTTEALIGRFTNMTVGMTNTTYADAATCHFFIGPPSLTATAVSFPCGEVKPRGRYISFHRKDLMEFCEVNAYALDD